MRTVGNTFVRASDQAAVVQALIRLFGDKSTPEAEVLRRQLRPYTPVSAATRHQEAFNRIVSTCFSDILPAVYVSPCINGWVGVYDRSLEGTDDPQPDLARALSRELQTVAVSFWLLHGDLFRYFVAESGKLRDEYMFFTSALDREELAFLTGQSLTGNPRLLSRLSGQPAAEAVLEQLLADETLIPMEMLGGVASALGIPLWSFSHQYLIDQPTRDLPACWDRFAVITQGQLGYVPGHVSQAAS
ncbi:MAG TPA: hypothetical protein VNT75_17580 [Symbiobacteriaceae bacterium]|nr:hypothetical protein [Symbiobacteriaceae bacterium]